MSKLKDISGQRFGRLKAIKPAGKQGKRRLYECVCDCGTVKKVQMGALTSGNTKSCGCLPRGRKKYKVNSKVVKAHKPKKKILNQLPKILLLDIETSPMEVYVWHLYQKFISPDAIIKDWSILSWSAKWLFDTVIYSAKVTPPEARARRDRSIIKGIWNLMDEADIIVAHYGNVFDIRRLNTRFLVNGLNPPSPFQIVDTVKTTKKTFAISSYKMEYLNGLFKLQPKIETNFSLWERCTKGDIKALKEMEKYNRHDVTALEELYLTLRPWIKSHPNAALYMDECKESCPNCGNSKLTWSGHYYTPAGRYAAFRCKSCGAIGRSRFNDLSDERRKSLTRSVAR